MIVKTYDQAVDELMHGETEILRDSVLTEASLMGSNEQTLNTLRRYNHAQLVNWWISYFKWAEKSQIWQFRQQTTKPN